MRALPVSAAGQKPHEPVVGLSDAQWSAIEPLLPPSPVRPGGRAAVSNRVVVECLLWMLFTGQSCHELPDGSCSAATCCRRFKDWKRDGTWARVWETFVASLDPAERQVWQTALVAGTFTPVSDPATGLARGPRPVSRWRWDSLAAFRGSSPATPRPHAPHMRR